MVASGNDDGSSESNVQVSVRCRGRSESEKKGGHTNVVKCNARVNNTVDVLCPNALTATFAFDQVFGPNTAQDTVFADVATDTLNDVLRGYDCTIFAYGQTGSGKTYTMLGEKGLSGDWSTSPNAGLIPRCIIELFKALDQSLKSYQLSVSYLELHNNKLLDLLVLDDRRPPRILRNAEGNDVMVGMERPDVNSVHDAYKVLSQGLKKRKVAATKMNINSSRSHTVFTVYVDITETDAMGQEIRRNGSLNLVDLGGSENIERSGAVHARAREAGNINQDLLHLGTVIRNLVEGKIIEGMYRGKVLTQLLRNSLGGKAKTKFIATVGPASCNVQETLRTLEYCFTAKNVKNRPEMNATCMNKSFIDEDDESLYVNKYEKEIIRLRKDLFAAREQNGMYMSQESYDQQQQHTTSLQDQCNELNGILSIIKEQHQREKSALMDQLMEAKDQLKEHEVDINKKAYIIEERRKEEDLLYREAAELKDVITHLTAQVTHLSTYARDADTAQTSNCKGARDLEVQLTGVCDTLSNSTRDFSANQKHSLDAFKTFLLDHIETEAQQYDAMANGLQTTEHSLTAQVQLMSTHLTDTLTAIAHASDPTQHHNALERVTALSKSVAQDIESLLKGIHDMLNDRGNQAEKLRETIEHQATQLGNAVVHFGAAQVDQFVALNQDLDRMLAAERQKVTDHIARHTTESANDNATQHAHYQQLQTTLIAAVTQGMDTCRTLTQTAAEQSQRRTRERLYAVVRGIDQCTTAYGNMIADAKEDALMQTDSLREGCEELGNATTPHLQAEAHTTITAQTKLTEIQSVSSNSDATITSELEALAHEITKGKAAVNDTVSTGLRALSEHTESLSKEVGQQIVGVKDELATAKDALSTHRQHYDTHVEALTDTVTTHIRSVLDATEESVSAVRHTTAALRTNTAPPHVDVHVYDDLLARPLTRPKTLDKLMLEFYSQRPMSPEPTAECDDTHNTAAEEETHALHNTMQRLSMSTTYATSGRENRSPDFRDTKRNLADTSITPVREAISKRIEFGAGDD